MFRVGLWLKADMAMFLKQARLPAIRGESIFHNQMSTPNKTKP